MKASPREDVEGLVERLKRPTQSRHVGQCQGCYDAEREQAAQALSVLQARVGEVEKERDEAQARCRRIGAPEDDEWLDEREVTWVRPTAWAYAMACAANDKNTARAQAAEARLAEMVEALTYIADTNDWYGQQRFAEDSDADFLLRVMSAGRAFARSRLNGEDRTREEG
jgi:hypothetical protein